MRHIGNIVFDTSIDKTGLYNICKLDEVEPGIPTLIVGWENVKKLYPDQCIINWKIDENTYWTYGKREKRDRYEKDINAFMSLCVKNAKKTIEYIFFDMFLCDEECKVELKNLIIGSGSKTCYFSNGMAYIYSDDDEVVYGIQLNDIDYEGKKSTVVINLIRENEHIKVINNVSFKTKELFVNNQYIIPYIYSN